jgi:hypothetical protein
MNFDEDEYFASRWSDPAEMVRALLFAPPPANFGSTRGPEPIPLAKTPQNLTGLGQKNTRSVEILENERSYANLHKMCQMPKMAPPMSGNHDYGVAFETSEKGSPLFAKELRASGQGPHGFHALVRRDHGNRGKNYDDSWKIFTNEDEKNGHYFDKLDDLLNTKNKEAAMRIISGTAKNMGITIKE